jgi:acylphosphatase
MVENIKTYDVLISGRVQGVGFRYFTVSRAENYGVKGYVKNTPEGKVQIICQGEQDELDSFISAVKKGPSFSVITDIRIEEAPEEKKYNTFEIKY